MNGNTQMLHMMLISTDSHENLFWRSKRRTLKVCPIVKTISLQLVLCDCLQRNDCCAAFLCNPKSAVYYKGDYC